MRWSRVLSLLFLVSLLAGLYWWLPRGERGVAVEIGAASTRPEFRAFVSASGEIVASRFADIGASSMGRIVELPVEEGQQVRAGQLLAKIDSIQARSELEAAQAQVRTLEAEAGAASDQVAAARHQLEQIRARAREANLQRERLQTLFDEGVVARSELDSAIAASDASNAEAASGEVAVKRAEQTFQAARRRISQARAQASRIQDVLDKTEIRAPISGIVTRLDVREGEMVVIGIQNQPGSQLMTISDLGIINAAVKVAEAEIISVQQGQPASVTLQAFPDRAFSGRVVQVGSSAVTATPGQTSAREFRVVIQLDEPDPRLKPGLTCDAEIEVARLTDVVTVPLQSVVLRQHNGTECTGVFLASNGRAQFREIETSVIGGLDVVVSGLKPGERIITGPYQLLRELQDGARIEPQVLP